MSVKEDREVSGGVLGALSGIVRSGRVYMGVTTNALSSLGNFAVSIALARVLGISELGEFAIAFAVYTFCTGLIRASVCEPSLASGRSRAVLLAGSRRASLTALASAMLIALAGVAASLPYLIVLGLAVHGLSMYDYSKTMNLAMFDRRVPLFQEATWFAASVAAGGLLLMGWVTGLQGFAIWALSGAAIGYASVVWQALDLRPRWNLARADTVNAIAFGGDYVIGSGASQVAFNLIGVVAGLPAVGSLRAGGTLLGPVSIVLSSARTLTIPYLTRGIAQGRQTAAARTLASTVIIAVGSLPLLALIAFLPSAAGDLLLGDNWSHAQAVLPFLAMEMAFNALVTVPFAGFRALLAGRSTVIIRSALAVMRVSAVVVAAMLGGAAAAAVALGVAAGVGALVWWVAYLTQLRSAVQRAP